MNKKQQDRLIIRVTLLAVLSVFTLTIYLSMPRDRKSIHFYIDSSFSPDQIENIKTGIERWNVALPCGYLNLTYETIEIRRGEEAGFFLDGKQTIYNTIRFHKFFSRDSSDGSTIAAVAIYQLGDIFIFSTSDLENIVAHEVGHVIINSSWHSEDPSSVMYYLVGENQEVKKEDVEKVLQQQ